MKFTQLYFDVQYYFKIGYISVEFPRNVTVFSVNYSQGGNPGELRKIREVKFSMKIRDVPG